MSTRWLYSSMILMTLMLVSARASIVSNTVADKQMDAHARFMKSMQELQQAHHVDHQGIKLNKVNETVQDHGIILKTSFKSLSPSATNNNDTPSTAGEQLAAPGVNRSCPDFVQGEEYGIDCPENAILQTTDQGWPVGWVVAMLGANLGLVVIVSGVVWKVARKEVERIARGSQASWKAPSNPKNQYKLHML